MLLLYRRDDGRIDAETPQINDPIPTGAVWLDLFDPTPEEKAWVEARTAITIPTRTEMREIEPSSRLYRRGDQLYLTASVLNLSDTDEPETRAVTFVLVDGLVVTIRYCQPLPFRTFPERLKTQPDLAATAPVALLSLLDAIVDRVADTLEMVDATVASVSRGIFVIDESSKKNRDYTKELRGIGLNAYRCSKVDESLVSLSRLLTYLDAQFRETGKKTVRPRLKTLERDVVSLLGYTERLSEKLELMLEATLGMINIQQTGIIKIFSVIAVVFLPPTVVASTYGMNFEIMPELSWDLGYPFALLLMLVSAVLPYLFFKYKGWL
jgi:magnesium transporter